MATDLGDDGIGRREVYSVLFPGDMGFDGGFVVGLFSFAFVLGELGKMFLGSLVGILCFHGYFEWFTRCLAGHVIGIDLKKV